MKFRNPFAESKAGAASARRRLAVEPLDDRVVPATLSISDATVMEGTSGVQTAAVTVTLSAPLKRPVSVNYGTSNSSATAGSDYAAASGKLAFARGETAKTILVPVYGDQQPEDNEYFSVRLSGARGAQIVDNTGWVNIVDSSPRLNISAEYGDEGSVMTFTVTLSAPLSTTFTVDFTTGDYLAVAGEDYVATSGTLTFAPGETTKTFTVQTLADGVEEYDEDFIVWLSNPSAPVFYTGDSWGYIYGELGPWW